MAGSMIGAEETPSLTGSVVSSVKSYSCDHPNCTKSYSKPSLLAQHKRSHTGERPFKCDYPDCDKSFLRKSHLKAHEVSHQDLKAKPFHCSVCGKGVNTVQHLKRHEITHTKSFKCDFDGCNESFYKHQSLRHHVLSVHEKTLFCKTCNKSFSRPYRLAQHNIKYHSETPTYQCDFKGCFKNFMTWSALQLHVKTDHPKLKCDICGKGCVGRQGLQSHMVTHTTGITKLWNCAYCDMGQFAKKIALINHYHEFHDGNVPDDLLRPEEQEELDKQLEQNSAFQLGDLAALPQAEESPKPDGPSSHKSLASLNSALSKNSSIIDLLLKNYNTRTIPCTKERCNRFFSREHDLRRHLQWHEDQLKKINSYLESLKKDEINDENDDNEIDDSNMDQMIDDELKKLQQESIAN